MEALTRVYFATLLGLGAMISFAAVAEYAVLPMMVSNGFITDVVSPTVASGMLGM